MQGGAVLLPGVGDQCGEHVGKAIVGAAMTRVLDLAHMFELLSDTFYQGPFTQQKLIK